jgi:hypothetical protein
MKKLIIFNKKKFLKLKMQMLRIVMQKQIKKLHMHK